MGRWNTSAIRSSWSSANCRGGLASLEMAGIQPLCSSAGCSASRPSRLLLEPSSFSNPVVTSSPPALCPEPITLCYTDFLLCQLPCSIVSSIRTGTCVLCSFLDSPLSGPGLAQGLVSCLLNEWVDRVDGRNPLKVPGWLYYREAVSLETVSWLCLCIEIILFCFFF